MHPALRLVRVGNVVVSFAGTIVGGLDAEAGGWSHSPVFYAAIVLAGLSTSCVTAGGNVLNDLGDRESDRVNHPDRPLVTGAISLTGARRLVVALLVASVVLAVPVAIAEPLVGLILAVALAAVLSYEYRFKAAGFAGNGLVALLTGLVFLYGGAAAGNAFLLIPFAAMAFLATLSREVIKDMEDIAGDVTRQTLPKTRGIPFSSATARVAVGGAVALSFVPFLVFLSIFSVAGVAYLGIVLVADATFVASVAALPRRLHWSQTVSKGAMAIALLAFLTVGFR